MCWDYPGHQESCAIKRWLRWKSSLAVKKLPDFCPSLRWCKRLTGFAKKSSKGTSFSSFQICEACNLLPHFLGRYDPQKTPRPPQIPDKTARSHRRHKSTRAPCWRRGPASHALAVQIARPSPFARSNPQCSPPPQWRHQWYARRRWPGNFAISWERIQNLPAKPIFFIQISYTGYPQVIKKKQAIRTKFQIRLLGPAPNNQPPDPPPESPESPDGSASEDKSAWPGLSIKLIKWPWAPVPSSASCSKYKGTPTVSEVGNCCRISTSEGILPAMCLHLFSKRCRRVDPSKHKALCMV